MAAITWDLTIEAGSWEPQYIVLSDPDTNLPLDLTASGYTARMVVATRSDGAGTVLADLGDEQVFRRTNTGRLYFEPAPEITSGWVWRFGYHQIELTMPTLDLPVRVAAGRVRVSPELVLDPA